jgi:hypothetical protein
MCSRKPLPTRGPLFDNSPIRIAAKNASRPAQSARGHRGSDQRPAGTNAALVRGDGRRQLAVENLRASARDCSFSGVFHVPRNHPRTPCLTRSHFKRGNPMFYGTLKRQSRHSVFALDEKMFYAADCRSAFSASRRLASRPRPCCMEQLWNNVRADSLCFPALPRKHCSMDLRVFFARGSREQSHLRLVDTEFHGRESHSSLNPGSKNLHLSGLCAQTLRLYFQALHFKIFCAKNP